MNKIQTLKDGELLKQFEVLVKEEKESIAFVVIHLAEIDRRKLYALEGYSSLFNYCVEKYHFSESGAYRRIQAARLSNRFPEIIGLLKEGKLNLETISLIFSHLTSYNKEKLLSQVFHKSTREVESIISYSFGKEKVMPDKIRLLPPVKKAEETAQSFTSGAGSDPKGHPCESRDPSPVSQKETGTFLGMSLSLSGTAHKHKEEIRRVKIEFVADEEVAKKIERAKQILRHKYPQGKLENIIDEALEALLEKKDPLHRHPEPEATRGAGRRIQSRSGSLATPCRASLGMTEESGMTNKGESRYIPKELKREIWKRDKGKCTFQSKEGRQCNEQGMIEVDHVQPWSLWGKSTLNNLRLLCRSHNQYRNQKTFVLQV